MSNERWPDYHLRLHPAHAKRVDKAIEKIREKQGTKYLAIDFFRDAIREKLEKHEREAA